MEELSVAEITTALSQVRRSVANFQCIYTYLYRMPGPRGWTIWTVVSGDGQLVSASCNG